MNIEEIRRAMVDERELEYHVTGGEIDPDGTLPAPGWYPCTIDEMCANGTVEITLHAPLPDENAYHGLEVTVLGKNIPVAFRRQQAEPPTGAGLDERAVTQHFAQGEIDSGTAAYMLSLERPAQKGHPYAEWCAWLTACLHEITESFFDLSTTPEIRFEPCGDGKSCFCHFHTSVYGELVPLDGEPFLVLHDYAPYLDGDPKEVA